MRPFRRPDWREWLTRNVAYAQGELHLYGLTNQAPGLVIIGRDDPSADRNASRAQSAEGPRIAIHSWDWLLRHAQNLSANVVRVSKFARENAVIRADSAGVGVSTSFEEDIPEYDDEVADLELDDLF